MVPLRKRGEEESDEVREGRDKGIRGKQKEEMKKIRRSKERRSRGKERGKKKKGGLKGREE